MCCNITLISIDLDGTLLNENGDISNLNLAALKEADNHEIEIVLCTGRPYPFVKKLLEKYGLSYASICSNGALIVSKGQTFLKKVNLQYSLFKKLYHFLIERGLYFEIDIATGSYIDFPIQKNMCDMIKELYPKATEEQVQKASNRKIESGEIIYIQNALDSFKTNEPLKLFVYSHNTEKIKKIKVQMSKFSNFVNITESGGSDNIEITARGVTKASGLEFYTSYYNHSLMRTASIGDSMNDIGMFKISGLAVAMKNADPSVLKYCHVITDHHEQDGVATIIEYLLHKPDLKGGDT